MANFYVYCFLNALLIRFKWVGHSLEKITTGMPIEI